MADTVQCPTHGERPRTYVCSHLGGDSAGLGFNRADPESRNPFPDAWCDDCELIRSAHGGWTAESEKLIRLLLLCSGCYERARIRNMRTTVTLDDLADLRWKCHTCEQWHSGPCLDFGYDAPDYWREEYAESSRQARLVSDWSRKRHKSFLNEDYCAIEDGDFFVRGLILLPIIGTAQCLCWGVWGSVSRQNFESLAENDAKPGGAKLAPMFSWLSSRIPEYPDTINLKMYAHIQPPGKRPHFELEPTDHPLSHEFHHGIAPQRVKEIMKAQLRECE